MTQMTTRDAAGRLGISQRQVQRLIAAGRLPSTRTAGDAWVVEALAVNAMTRARPDRGRPWSPATAWAALWRLSGLEVDWLDRRTTSRLTARLKSISPEELLHATRRRAVIGRYRVSESFLAELRSAVVLSGAGAMTAATFGMEAASTSLDGYCDSEASNRVVHDFHLIEARRGCLHAKGRGRHRARAREDDGTPQLSQERFAHAVATDDGAAAGGVKELLGADRLQPGSEPACRPAIEPVDFQA